MPLCFWAKFTFQLCTFRLKPWAYYYCLYYYILLLSHTLLTFLIQKGFPLETSLDEIQEWLTGKGAIENIQMRRNLQRQFKVCWTYFITNRFPWEFQEICPNTLISLQGSVFVCFDTEESSKKFLERSDIKSFKDNEMLVLAR